MVSPRKIIIAFIAFSLLSLGALEVHAEQVSHEQIVCEPEQEIVKHTSLPDNEVLLEQYVEEQAAQAIAEPAKPGASKATRGSRLTGNDKIIYDELKDEIISIAAGQREDTVIEIPMISNGIVEKRFYTAEELGLKLLL